MAEAAGRRSREPQLGSRSCGGEMGCIRGQWHSLDFADITRSKDTTGQRGIVQKSFWFVLFMSHQLKLSIIRKLMILAVILRKNCFPEFVLGSLL